MNKAALLLKTEVLQGDLTKRKVTAIVNAANRSLLGGGGVDGAIHRAAGPGLAAECAAKHPMGCRVGEARLTTAHALPADYVIHTVGPVYKGGQCGEQELLASCYENAIRIAAEEGFQSIAFPAISCGVYGYPIQEAAPIAIETVIQKLADAPSIERVEFVLFSEADRDCYLKAYETLREKWTQ